MKTDGLKRATSVARSAGLGSSLTRSPGYARCARSPGAITYRRFAADCNLKRKPKSADKSAHSKNREAAAACKRIIQMRDGHIVQS
jgi:hypothetical protein